MHYSFKRSWLDLEMITLEASLESREASLEEA